MDSVKVAGITFAAEDRFDVCEVRPEAAVSLELVDAVRPCWTTLSEKSTSEAEGFRRAAVEEAGRLGNGSEIPRAIAFDAKASWISASPVPSLYPKTSRT